LYRGFEWGTSTGIYTDYKWSANGGRGYAADDFSRTIGSLTADETYYYRSMAFHQFGDKMSIDLGNNTSGVTTWDKQNARWGRYSAKIVHTAVEGSAYAQFVPINTMGATTITPDCLATIDADPEWSFWYMVPTATNVWSVQLELHFVSENYTDTGYGFVDVTLMPLQYTNTDGEWHKVSIVATDKPAWCYYGSDPTDGTEFFKMSNWHLADLTGILTDINAEAAMIAGSDTADDWLLTRVKLEVYEGVERTTYVDDTTIEGITYRFEKGKFYPGQWGYGTEVDFTTLAE
jgi:hypothetical protein